jgi:hypothetical protein
MAGYGGKPGNGPGWGGPAKGFVSKPPRAFDGTEPEFQNNRASEMNSDSETVQYRLARRKRNRELREFAEENQVHVIEEARKKAEDSTEGKLSDFIMALALVSSATDRLMSKLPDEHLEDGDNTDDPVKIVGGLPD